MSTRNKVLILVASVWPLLYVSAFIIFSGQITNLDKQYGDFVSFLWLTLHVSAIISWFVVTFVYEWHVFMRNKIGRFGKTVWVIALASFGPLAFPFYWAIYIVRDRDISPGITEERPTQKTSQQEGVSVQTKVSKTLAIATFWPISYPTVFTTFLLGIVVSLTIYSNLPIALPRNVEGLDLLMLIPVAVIFSVHIATMFLSLGVYVYYLVNPFINTGVPREQKLLWFLINFFGHLYVWPFYWYFNILQKGKNYSL